VYHHRGRPPIVQQSPKEMLGPLPDELGVDAAEIARDRKTEAREERECERDDRERERERERERDGETIAERRRKIAVEYNAVCGRVSEVSLSLSLRQRAEAGRAPTRARRCALE